MSRIRFDGPPDGRWPQDRDGPVNLLSKIAAPWSGTPMYQAVCLERIVANVVANGEALSSDSDEGLSRTSTGLSLHEFEDNGSEARSQRPPPKAASGSNMLLFHRF